MAQTQSPLETLELAAQQLANALNLPVPRGQGEREALCRAAQLALDAPNLEGVAPRSAQWQDQGEELGALVSAGLALTHLHSEFDRSIMPDAWEQDLKELRQILTAKGEGLTRRLSGDYRRAERQLSGLFHQPRPSDLETRLKLMDAIAQAQQWGEAIDQRASLGAELFGSEWSGQDSDWTTISQITEWAQELHTQIESGLVPGGIVEYLSGNYSPALLEPLVSAVVAATEAYAAGAAVVRNGLESARKELLDLGLRNPLLNYRLLRTRGLEVVDEVPAEVYRQLTAEGKAMTFLPAREEATPEPDSNEVFGDGFGQPAENEVVNNLAVRHTDSRLQTALSSAELQSRLLSTYHLSNTFIQEQGVNTLFLALGMLTWMEDDGGEPRKAPLVLVPVALDRSSVRTRFQLRYTGDDPGDNLSLRERLRSEFGVQLPELPDPEDLNLVSYLDAVEGAVSEFPEWAVDRGSIVLGFFSFSKFLMYRDLDTIIWPDNAKPEEHSIIGALLNEGFYEPEPSISNDEHLDQYLPPSQVHHVVDADSSQTLALVDVNDGRNLVVQGPPGTGKSQTITNMIAEALGHGRTVLFVSEKMAALEVVKRRLDAIGLGDACLELHSHKSTKKTVLAELERTLEQGRPRLGQIESDLDTLSTLRKRLNYYCKDVNSPVGETGVSPYLAYGELALLRKRTEGVQLPKLDQPLMKTWSEGEFRDRQEAVKELQARLAIVGVPQKHPFWGTRRRVMLPSDLERVRNALPPTHTSLESVIHAAEVLAGAMGLPVPSGIAESNGLCMAVSRVLEAPELAGLNLRAEEWRTRREEIASILKDGAKLFGLRSTYQSVLKPESWSFDLVELRDLLDSKGRQMWRLFSSDYLRGKARLAGLCQGALPSGLAAQLEMLDAIATAQHLGRTISAGDSLGKSVFGAKWQSESSDWDSLSTCSDWFWWQLDDIDLGNLPREIVGFLAEGRSTQDLSGASSAVVEAISQHRRNVDEVVEALDLDLAKRYPSGRRFEDQPFPDQQTTFEEWGQRLNDIHDMVGFNNISDDCLNAGLESVLSVAENWDEARNHLMDAFLLARYEALLGVALEEREALRGFDGANHHRLIQQFRELDILALEHNRSRLALAHWEGLPRQEGGGQVAVLRREFQKRSRHLPIRQLIARAGNAVQAIKPVFMMSPLSIATYIPPGSLNFDLVIFDEASQVRPVDAFGAILRARQSVVVGDSQQLPPTSFFDTMTQGNEENEENNTANIESVLGLFAAQGAPDRMLRWHYRSRHESLIAVSNQEFYKNSLVVFPSPDAERREGGLKSHYLPDTAYDRGGTRTNPLEADAVATAVMEHASSHPHLTLGVAAFSVAQMRAIQDAVEIRRRSDPSQEGFFSDHPDEPFFVKNLETVQGDERDVIFISIGYGKDADGNVAMNFGPLNWDGGERRLNVLITRARRRCEVFTNLSAEDIDVSRTSAPGVLALKTFLAYAGTEDTNGAAVGTEVPGSSLEQAVALSLAESGYQLRPQIGAAGHYVDLAVVDPEQPGRYLMGIETDGETYHNSRSSRDRDRLREQVLNGLGWQIHHIWSTNWFNHPDRELRRATEAIESAKNSKATSRERVAERSEVQRESVVAVADGDTIAEYHWATPKAAFEGSGFPTEADPALALWVAQVVDLESPVHSSEVARRIADAAGIRRVKRFQQAMDRAIEHGVASGSIAKTGDFLWRSDMTEPALRDRSELPASSRKIEFVAPEEVTLAVRRVVAASYGIAFHDITGAVLKLLGFGRVTADMRSRIEPLISQMVTDGALERQGDLLVIANGHSE